MEAIGPRSIPHRRRCTTTAVARRINTVVITTLHRAITRLNRVTTRRRVITNRPLATIPPAPAPVIDLIQTRAGGIMGEMVGTDAVPTMEAAAAVTVDGLYCKRRMMRRFFVGAVYPYCQI